MLDEADRGDSEEKHSTHSYSLFENSKEHENLAKPDQRQPGVKPSICSPVPTPAIAQSWNLETQHLSISDPANIETLQTRATVRTPEGRVEPARSDAERHRCPTEY